MQYLDCSVRLGFMWGIYTKNGKSVAEGRRGVGRELNITSCAGMAEQGSSIY